MHRRTRSSKHLATKQFDRDCRLARSGCAGMLRRISLQVWRKAAQSSRSAKRAWSQDLPASIRSAARVRCSSRSLVRDQLAEYRNSRTPLKASVENGCVMANLGLG